MLMQTLRRQPQNCAAARFAAAGLPAFLYDSPVTAAPAFPIPAQPVVEPGALFRTASSLPSLLDLSNSLMTRSGRSALLLALRLAGVVPGDRVLVPTYHCPTMIAPVERLAARPVFYPITDSGEPDLTYLSRSDLHGVRAMIVAHLFGVPRSLRRLVEFCHSADIRVIEDCAHCFFGAADGVPVGASGEFAVGSLPKFFPVLEGGLLAWRDRALRVQLTGRLRPTAEMRAVWDLLDLSAGAGRLGLLGAATRGVTSLRRLARPRKAQVAGELQGMPSPQKIRDMALADPLLEPAIIRRVECWVVTHSDLGESCVRRRDNFRTLASLLSAVAGARPLFPDCPPDSAPYVMPLLLQDPERPYALMREMRLPVFRWDYVWPETPRISGDAAATWTRGVVQIACHQSLTRGEIDSIAATIARCLETARSGG